MGLNFQGPKGVKVWQQDILAPSVKNTALVFIYTNSDRF